MQFKPGNEYGTGRPATPEDVKVARKLTQPMFEQLCNKYLSMSKDEIDTARKDPKLTMLEVMIVSVIHKAIVHGDQKRLDFLLDRLIGKVVQPIEYHPPPPPKQIQFDVTQLPTEVLKQLAQATEIIDVTPKSDE